MRIQREYRDIKRANVIRIRLRAPVTDESMRFRKRDRLGIWIYRADLKALFAPRRRVKSLAGRFPG